MIISFNTYNELLTHQKIEFFDNINLHLKPIDLSKKNESKKIKKQLVQILNNQSENNYIRRAALDVICKLTIIKTESFRVNGTSDLLLDLEVNEDPFILALAVKYLFYFHVTDESETIKKLQDLLVHKSGEVTSEVYFRLGQIYFFKAENNDFLKNLSEAQRFFEKASQEIENRVDAKLFYELTKLLLAPNDIERRVHLSAITSIIWTIEVFEEKHEVNALYMALYKIVFSITELLSQKIDTFIDRAKYNQLVCIHYEIINSQLSEELGDLFLTELKSNLKTEYVEPFYINNFNADKARVRGLKNSAKKKEEIDFWDYVLNLDTSIDAKKKDFNDVLLYAHELLPDISIPDLTQMFEGKDLGNMTTVLQILTDANAIKKPKSMRTGSNVGDDILKEQIDSLKNLVPNYPKDRFLEFEMIFEDIIRYIRRTTEVSRSDPNFKFLFNKDALEKKLQSSMINAFKMLSDRADFYSEESPESTDGGRIDVKYQSSYLTIPIELKRTKIILNEDIIKTKYLSQAQTYIYNKNQLGFFVVLDSSEKDPKKPMNNLRDLFGIIHLETHHKVNEKHPDYVIWCIVPGNKILPSARSVYA